MGRIALLYRLILRPLFRQPGRALVILFAVALGDAAVVAIDLAGDAAAGSFHSSMETLAGKDDFEVTAAGGLPEAIVTRIARLPYALRISPRIEDHAMVIATGETVSLAVPQTMPQTVPLIGVDLVAEANNADQVLQNVTAQDATAGMATAGQGIEHINDPDAVWVTPGLKKSVGDTIQLLINDQAKKYVVRGLIPNSARLGTDAILMDLGAAQKATGKSGRVDRILIKFPDAAGANNFRSVAKEAAAGAPGRRAPECPGNRDRCQSAHARRFPLESADAQRHRPAGGRLSHLQRRLCIRCASARRYRHHARPWAPAAPPSWVHFSSRQRCSAPSVLWPRCLWADYSPPEP